LQARRVDLFDAVYVDTGAPAATYSGPFDVPRGASIAFQFAVKSNTSRTFDIAATIFQQLSGSVRLYRSIPSYVEANSNGYETEVGKVPSWIDELTRSAPFYINDALAPATSIKLPANEWRSIVIEIDIAPNAVVRGYNGELTLSISCSCKATVALPVFKVSLVDLPVATTTWHRDIVLSAKNLTNGVPPTTWNEEHWQLIEGSVAEAAKAGDMSASIPVLYGCKPVVQTTRTLNGTYVFDFSRFDQLMAIFRSSGMTTFFGNPVAGGNEVYAISDIWGYDEATGTTKVLFSKGDKGYAFESFIGDLCSALDSHLMNNGWATDFYLRLVDEPLKLEDYSRIHAECPMLRTAEAINGSGLSPQDLETMTNLVDYWFAPFGVLENNSSLIHNRSIQGKKTGYYLLLNYSMPPSPGIHLDRDLTQSRVIPLLVAHYGVDGFFHWAGNRYRGADPYASSIGPFPNGSQSPGYPPGENWQMYPTSNGLIPSVRMFAMREGLIDLALIKALEDKDKALAATTLDLVVRSLSKYEKTPAAYYDFRHKLIECLE
jgi:hypothetical protein